MKYSKNAFFYGYIFWLICITLQPKLVKREIRNTKVCNKKFFNIEKERWSQMASLSKSSAAECVVKAKVLKININICILRIMGVLSAIRKWTTLSLRCWWCGVVAALTASFIAVANFVGFAYWRAAGSVGC